MPFFKYRQNNSHGRFSVPAIDVYVEGETSEEADKRAELIGLYFDGVGDCTCCGPRWDNWDDDEVDLPNAEVERVVVDGYTCFAAKGLSGYIDDKRAEREGIYSVLIFPCGATTRILMGEPEPEEEWPDPESADGYYIVNSDGSQRWVECDDWDN